MALISLRPWATFNAGLTLACLEYQGECRCILSEHQEHDFEDGSRQFVNVMSISVLWSKSIHVYFVGKEVD